MEDRMLQASKKKQKRNKPTLSCLECVEKKTKVRPWQRFLQYNRSQRPVVLHCGLPLGAR